MPIVLADRVKETTSTNGSGNIVFSGPLAGFQSFSSVLASGDQTYYTIVNKNNWEVGVGTYQSSTFSRDVILSSSNGGQRLNLTGNSNVFIAYPAEKSVYKDEVQRIVVESGIIFPDSSVQTTAFTAETAQDIVSSLLIAGTGIQLTYNDSGNSLAIDAYGILPTGGTAGQILSKVDGIDYNAQWIDNYTTEVVQYIKNSTHTTLYKGQVVYINGADGTNPTVALAVASGESTSSKTLGFLKQNLDQGEFGYVVTEGELGGLNTDGATTEGDTIWLSPTTPGGVVYGFANKPYAPDHMVFLGYVLRKNTNNGRIFVKVQNGFELEELHNVVARNPNNNDAILYDSASGVWRSQPLPPGYDNEQAQDAIGGILTNTPSINLSYNDNAPSISAILNDTAVSSGVYGSANQAPVFTVDAQGRLTAAANATITPSSIGALGSLNGLTGSTQTFATGTTGTDFNIVSSGTAHTFNIPDAGPTARGLITTGSQTFAGLKSFGSFVNPLDPQNKAINSNGWIVFNSRGNYYNSGLRFSDYGVIHAINGNGFAIGELTSHNGWYNGRQFFMKHNIGAWGFGAGLYDYTHGFFSPSEHITELVGGINAQTFRVYNSFTDTSNLERLALQFGTYSSTRHVQIAAESAGTGAANMNLVLTPKGTGAFIVGPPPDGTAVGGNARGASAIDIQTERNAATQVAGSYGVAIGSRCTVSGNSGSVAIGRNVNVSDSLAGAVGIGANITVTGHRGIVIGSGSAASDGIAITGSAAHSGAVCFGTFSRFSGKIRWKGNYFHPVGGNYGLGLTGAGVNNDLPSVRTTSNTLTTLHSEITSSWITNRSRHLAVAIFFRFSVIAVRSDGAINKYSRNVLVKDMSNVSGSSSTLSILQSETVGTDITQISGVSISLSTNSSTKSLIVSVTGESDYDVTGDASTNILTVVGNPFVNDDIVVFTSLTGGDGFSTNINGNYFQGHYRVINVSGNNFQLTTANGISTTPIDFTTDITAGKICRPINWYLCQSEFSITGGGY